jgi:hypothetical protein
MRDTKGLRYLAALLAVPAREMHVLELLAAAEGGPGTEAPVQSELRVTRGDGARDLAPDTRARAAYKEALHELEEEIGEAESARDLGRAERARERLERLHAELAATYGLGGRQRRAAGSPLERARKAVYNRVHDAIARIDDAHPQLARHLTKAIRTGATCVYLPARPISWDVRA